jgi:Subtilase family/PKD domain/Secretion system C-terminal sorting domain
MRLILLLLCVLSFFVTSAQNANLVVFSKQRNQQDSLENQAALAVSKSSSLPYQFTDAETKRTYLLTTNAAGEWSYRATLNQGAALSTGATALQDVNKGFQLTGEGITCGIWDDGLIANHSELDTRILSKEGGVLQNHATHVTGTILASGVNASARGMAPKAKAFTYYFDNDLAEMAAQAMQPDSLLFSNHSYGTVTGWSRSNGVWNWYGDANISTDEDYKHGFYGERAQAIDALAYLSPYYTIVWAAGNDRAEAGDGSKPADCNRGSGYDCIIPDAVGKNIITVGAVNKVPNYTNPASVGMSSFSSWGPTDDGRIKPDLVGAGVNIFSLSAAGNNTYTTSSGTSMAAPNVTGSLMLVQQLYAKLHVGSYMQSATVKGLAIHTAKEAGIKPGPDYQFGWGLLDVEAASTFILSADGYEKRIIESLLVQNEEHEFIIEPQLNKKITITLCWTDPEGNPVPNALDPPDRMLVNDLDIRLIDEDGLVQLPWILNPTVPQAQAMQGDNTRDNVEKIEFETPLTKKYKVVVKHKGVLQSGKQHYSLILSHQSKLSTSKIFYWVGGSGNWNDASHWSYTSGGITANALPTENDAVVFDAISVTAGNEITLTQSASCARFVWLANVQATLMLNANTLTVKCQLSLSSDKLQIVGDGTLLFSATDKGTVEISDIDFINTDLVFEQGNWLLSGKIKTDKIILLQGSHTWRHAQVEVNELIVNTVSAFDISKAKLTINSKLQLPSTPIQFISGDCQITVNSVDVVLDWQAHNYNGHLQIASTAVVTMRGSGSIYSLENNGSLTVEEAFDYSTLSLTEGSTYRISGNHTQRIQSLFTIQSSALLPVTIASSVKSNWQIDVHTKLCFDYLGVTNIDVIGDAIVNAGSNSTLQNANGWQQTDCENVLFPNFSTKFVCVGGLTKFLNESTGNVTNWTWNFGDEVSSNNVSTAQHPTHSYQQTGKYMVTLIINSIDGSATFTKEIEIVANTLPANQIISIDDAKLMSLFIADSYEWYVGSEQIVDTYNRTLDVSTTQGNFYEVVTIEGACNRISLPYLVTSVNITEQDMAIYPNPVNNYFTIECDENTFKSEGVIKNSLGQVIDTISTDEQISTLHLNEGIYFLQLKTRKGEILSRKIVVKH